MTLEIGHSIIPTEDDIRVKTVLIINESKLVSDFLKQKLESFGLGVVMAVNGFDGQLKIRNEEPNLIIMDYSLSRVSSTELLQAKAENPNKRSVPVIITGEKLSKERLMALENRGDPQALHGSAPKGPHYYDRYKADSAG